MKTCYIVLVLLFMGSCFHRTDSSDDTPNTADIGKDAVEPFPGEQIPQYEKSFLVYSDPDVLFSDLDMCPYWKETFVWDDFQKVRTHFKRKTLHRYVDKIIANKRLASEGFAVVPVLFSARDKVPFTDLLKKHDTFVAKPNHFSSGNFVFLVRNNKFFDGKRAVPEQIEKKMFESLDTPSNSNEWLLQNMDRGFLVQELIEGQIEYKIQTIWGKAAGGVIFDGKRNHYSFYYPDGRPVENYNAPELRGDDLKYWLNAVEIAEKVAKKTDGLRVDVLERRNDDGSRDLLINELELRSSMGWPTAEFRFAQRWSDGYRNKCVAHTSTE